MTEAARRKRLQIHLSTAVVLMFAAGGVIWANSTATITSLPFTAITDWHRRHVYGWPFAAVSKLSLSPGEMLGYGDFQVKGTSKGVTQIDYPFVALDALVAVFILVTTWFLCEWVIRRPWRNWRFQIHLSTAVVLMFVAGGFVCANTWPLGERVVHGPYGWPKVMYTPGFPFHIPQGNRSSLSDSDEDLLRSLFDLKPREPRGWKPSGVAIDVGLAVAMIVLSGFLCEWLIRRRAVRKGA